LRDTTPGPRHGAASDDSKEIRVHSKSELQLSLNLTRSELVRAFTREAALTEGALPATASLIAEDTLDVWLALCALASAHEHARIIVSSTHREIRSLILLQGHSRFSAIVASLAARIRCDAGLSYRERGIDGWEISLHRGLDQEIEPSELVDAPISPTTVAVAPTLALRTDLPQQADSAAIARCFLEVYGHNYVHTEVFSPQRYWNKVESGELIPVVTRDEKGEVIGHVALEREPGAPIAERGEAVVLPAYRGHHLLEQMTERLSEEAHKLGLVGVYAMPVTLHTFSQRNDERAGMPVCAALLGAAMESSRPKGLAAPTAGQRQSLLLTFRFLKKPASPKVYPPAPYREIVLQIYESLGVTVAACEPSEPTSIESKTRIKIDQRGYGKIHFEKIGPSAGIELKQALDDVRSLGARSVQLSAPVDDPGLPLLTSRARALGFFFCGIGPAFSEGTDTLLLQFLSDPLDTQKLQLFTRRTQDLVSFIEHDRSAVGPLLD
jgi:hypothetical protein